MSKEVKINYNNTFATQHSRDYYRGASFHWSGEWMVGAHYLSDDYNIDYVVHGQVLLACAKSHLSTLENEPKDFIRDESGTVIGVVSTYWDFVLSGIVGKSPGIKIQDNYWYICKDTGVPEEEQVWENTGVKAKMELSDLTPEEIEILQRPGKEVVTEFVNNTMTQSTGQDPTKIMSQKATTDALNTKASNSALSAAIENEVLRANNAYQPKGDYATNTRVDGLEEELNTFKEETADNFDSVGNSLETLQDNIDSVAESIPTKVSELENDSNYQTKTNVETLLEPINAVIPQEATALNQLADKNFVAVSISDARAAFKGVSAAGLTEQEFFTWANSLTVDENDYVFWNTEDSTGNAILKRYYRSGSSWIYEYTLNNNSFTAAEWLAIKSGITADMIPSQASASNQLADKAFVNSSIATSTANFRGTSAAGLTEAQFLTWANGLTHDENDYVYWNTVDSVGNVVFKRYKYSGNSWVYEYDLNNSSFTANEWAAIQSGITSDLVTKLTALPTNADLTAALNNKVDKVTGKQLSTEDYTTTEKEKLGRVTTILTNIQPDVEAWSGSSPGQATTHVYVSGINSENGMTSTVDLVDYLVPKDDRTNYTAAEKTKLAGIESNAQVNKLEGVQVNGVDLTITNKKVNVDISGKVDKVTNESLTPIRVENYLKTDYTGSYSEYSLTIKDNATNNSLIIPIGSTFTHSEKGKLGGIASGAQVNVIEEIQINGTTQTITNKTVNLPAYPTTLPASDVYAWAKAATKPSYNFSEINGTVADSQLPDTISSDITGTAMGLKTEKLTGQEFVYRATPNTIKAKSFTLDRIQGKSLAWNQLVKNGNFADTSIWIESNVNISASNNIGSIAATRDGDNYARQPISMVAGHKYLFTGEVNGATANELVFFVFFGTPGTSAGQWSSKQTSANVWEKKTYIFTCANNSYNEVRMQNGVNGTTNQYRNIKIVDLTLLYGSEIDGMTDAEILAKFESEYPGYHDYSAGKLISNDAEQLETVGRNVWDEEWELGSFNNTTGGKISYNDRIRSKNFIKIIPGNTYYAYFGENIYLFAWFYDDNFQYIEAGTQIMIQNQSFTPPNGAKYMRIATYGGTITTYNHNICINLSDESFNGQYESYRKVVLPLNLDDFWVKDGQGNQVHITGGLKSAGSVYDEIVGNKYVKRVGSVDLGNDLEWAKQKSETRGIVYRANLLDAKSTGCGICDKYIITTQVNDITISADKIGVIAPLFTSNIQINIKDSAYSDAATFKTAMNGVMLYYELATPIEYELVSPLVPTVKAGITEARISPNTDGLSAPFCCDMTYSVVDYTEYADRAGTLVKGASVDLTDITASGELSGNAFKVIAEHIAKLTSRVEALEAGVGTVDTLSSTSVDSANGYYINGDKTVIIGSGAPTMVPAFAGQFYINTSGPALYYAVNNSATTDWKQA